ncbi:MAG: hypothetical protein EOO36_16545, partial [Cytophagaceae bacterium]
MMPGLRCRSARCTSGWRSSGDTLRFDARPLLRHPEVQRALRQRKPGITFRHQNVGASPFYVVRKTDW